MSENAVWGQRRRIVARRPALARCPTAAARRFSTVVFPEWLSIASIVAFLSARSRDWSLPVSSPNEQSSREAHHHHQIVLIWRTPDLDDTDFRCGRIHDLLDALVVTVAPDDDGQQRAVRQFEKITIQFERDAVRVFRTSNEMVFLFVFPAFGLRQHDVHHACRVHLCEHKSRILFPILNPAGCQEKTVPDMEFEANTRVVTTIMRPHQGG